MPEEELYDITTDPHETINLVTSTKPEHQAALLKLRTATAQWIIDSKDQGADDDYSFPPEFLLDPPPAEKPNAKPPAKQAKKKQGS